MKLCPSCFEPFPDDARFCAFDGKELQKSNDRFLGKTIASRYRLIKKLGSGGMSVVYLARHELISRLSAIKILRPELSRIAEHRERFLREARAVNRINHENIVEITDVGESDGFAYLVMEYIEGESLLAHVQRGRLAWDRAVRIAMQVASALARAHQEQIIHRDLKPENILLVPPKAEGALEVVKLTDFGIAKVMGEPSITLNEQLFGTPGYIAPEYVGGISIDGRSDLYSLAVVLYEMVTGQLPFDGRGQSELLLKPLTNAPIPPSQRVPDIPPDLETLLLRGLARDPNDRPHDAFAFHDELGDLLRRLRKSTMPPPELEARPLDPREPINTMVDSVVSIETAEASKLVTSEMSSRWSAALAELETLIAKARKQGHTRAAHRAGELAMVAGEMLPRLERASRMVGDMQARVDRMEAEARAFRANLGNAIDVLVHDRSREVAHLEALRARRDSGAGGSWELEEEKRAEGIVSDLTFQIESLQKELDRKNAEQELALVKATGTLEGSLSALRRLTNEVVRTIDDGIDILQQTG